MKNDSLKIAIQKKGRLSEASLAYLSSLGLRFTPNGHYLIQKCEDREIDLILLRDDDIPEYVNRGIADFAIIGQNVLLEKQLNANIIRELDFAKCRLCIVVSIDAKKKNSGWEIYINGGRDATGIDAILFSKEMEKLGAGELLVNSLDRDGAKKGFDIDLLNSICGAVNIPVIASSGAGSAEDFVKVFNGTNVDAALAASIFHNENISIRRLKKTLRGNGIEIRL